jgi:CBS domain-containing protein
LSDERAAALIDQVFEEHAVHPSDTGISDLLRIPARDIMTKEVVWCAPEDAVQEVLAAMQQHNAGYVLVGRDGMLEGLVSNSNILGAISPYLRPTFAKWRRPEDDATLGIKIKWIMSRPVRTVKPDVPFATIIENMRRYGGRCVPVADGQGKVLGIITVFDLLLRVLEADGSSSWQGSPPQGPPLLI